MNISDEYLKEHGFDIYKEERPYSFEKFLWTHNVKVGHIDEYDEDLYHEELICIYKRYSYDDDHNPLFTYEISISVINPGLYKENIDFKQKLGANKELTVEYLETLRGVFGI